MTYLLSSDSSTRSSLFFFFFFFFNDTATTEIYTLSLHDALPALRGARGALGSTRRDRRRRPLAAAIRADGVRSEEHTSELQSHVNRVCRRLLEKKKHNDVRRAGVLVDEQHFSARLSTVVG